MSDIDFVLTYLDANDVEWQKEKNKYSPDKFADVNPNRYRDWDNLQYFFRGVEKYAPWVRKIHFVTCGHLPKWLNTEHPKLHIVRHEDYIPKEWLPTFSSRCIDMNLHRIDGLSEHFVYFNDDMFLTAPVKEEVFFQNGLPCDSAILSPQSFTSEEQIQLFLAPVMNLSLINKYFNRSKVMRSDPAKWFSPKYRGELFRTLTMLPYPRFRGFLPIHLPYSYNRSTYEKVWELEKDRLSEVSSHRFREVTDYNHWLFSYWQYASGEFSPRNPHLGHVYQLRTRTEAEKAGQSITGQKYKMICLNDAVCDSEEFEETVSIVNSALETILPGKSSFEK
ncbi:MAG: stealth family protein [Lachnospiraceae bacterium]|nr:stealth family protein [Lachnospiraceae bacterium]